MTTERLTPLTDLESDALTELANVAMARASVSLRTMIQHEVLLSVPNVEILAPKEAIARVAKPGNPNLVAVRQDFSGVFSGRALLIFPEASSLELVRVVVGRQLALEDIVDLEDEALAETGNVILNSWVATIANLLKKNLKMSLPVVIRRDQSHIFESVSPRESLILFHQVRYQPAANPGLCRLDDGRSVGRRAPIADCRLRGQSHPPTRLNSGADGTKAAPLPSSHR
jgi:chemotaxis protein CheC